MSPIDRAAEEVAFDAPAAENWTVGSHRHAGESPPLQPAADDRTSESRH